MSQPIEITGTKEQAAQAAVKELDTAAKRRFDVGQPELTVVGDHFKLPAEMLARVAAQLPKPPAIKTNMENIKQRTILEVQLKTLYRERDALGDCVKSQSAHHILSTEITEVQVKLQALYEQMSASPTKVELSSAGAQPKGTPEDVFEMSL
ncbi:hypothetical protein HDU88_000942 [Geranomyces variabilis]|nr:hypothetical protein HDU88_000942 [Geranomyces variabilis]